MEPDNRPQSDQVRPSSPFIEFNREEINQSIPQRFEKIALTYSDRLAVKTRDHALTYRELNLIANRVASAICAQKEPDETPVALLFEHDSPLIAATLGALKAGKIFVPLDGSFPLARMQYILKDSRARCILTDRKNLSIAKSIAQSSNRLITLEDLNSHANIDQPRKTISPDAFAYILYTSGSTGQSKGVIQNHLNLLHEMMAYTNNFHISAQDRLTLLASCSSGQGIKNVFCALLNGAALYPLNIKSQGIAGLAAYLQQEEITVYHSGVTLFRYFLKTLTGTEVFSRLRLIRLASQQVLKEDIDSYRKHFSPHCILVNALSTTETGTFRWFFINQETVIDGQSIPVGYAVEDKKVLLLDDDGREVGLNQTGEIAIASRYISPGYWEKADLTEAKFIPTEIGKGERLYLSGDLGKMTAAGCLTYVGRKDFRVKIRGYSVEIAEIETALNEHRDIKETVVVAREDRSGDMRLVAYLVPTNPFAPAVSELRAFLKETLPDYMIPSCFVALDSLPLLLNGEVDRMALPSPDYTRPELATPFVIPRTPVEIELAAIWAKVLEIERVGIHDDFFALGGHSLMIFRLFAEIESEFGKRLPIATLFQAPTVDQLARCLTEKNQVMPSPLIPVQPSGSKSPFFCAHGSNSYVHMARWLGPDQPFYGMAQHLEGRKVRHTRIEEIAAYYLSEVRRVQPEGPYYLGGHSIGGLIAFEMAQQLRRQSQEVALLVLLDSNCPKDPASLSPTTSPFAACHHARWRSFYWRVLSVLGFDGRPSGPLQKLKDEIRRKIIAVTCEFFHLCKVPPPARLQSLYVDEIVYGIFYPGAAKRYRPQPYPGQVVYFKSDADTPERLVRWRKVISGNLEVYKVSGDHTGMLVEPHVSNLAQGLKTCLAKTTPSQYLTRHEVKPG